MWRRRRATCNHLPQVGHHPELLAQQHHKQREGGGVHQLILSPQVGHHPELLAQQHQHLLQQGWRPSTKSFTPVTSFYKCGVTSFYKCGGVLIPEVQLQLLQDQHTPSLRGCSRAARQAPMWVVVRPARSEKKATCCSDGSVNMQQGGA